MDNLGLRTATPMGDWRSFVKLTCPTSGGWVKGELYLVGATVGASVDDYDYGDADSVLIYHAEKIEVYKLTATGDVFAPGDKVYFDATTRKVTKTVGANLWIGIAVDYALATDTTVIIDLKGDKAT